ncbi:MAG: sugar ABC transporter ATP-binding protein [Alphaproteobacteria bacterium]
MSEPPPQLAVLEVSKAFPGVQALDSVSLTLEPGQIHALLGENGAGKSTLIKILTGVHRPDTGEVRLRGQPLAFQTPRDAIAAGIGVVHQERNLIPRFSAGENIMLEQLPTRHGLVDYDAVHREAGRWLDALNLHIDPRTPVHRLSPAQMQLVEIAKALSMRSRILLLDEPTASITPHETEVLFRLLQALRDDGVTIVFVSHKLEEVFQICDHVTVLRDGRNACHSQPIAGMTRTDVVRLMIGRDEQIARLGERKIAEGTPALELEDVTTAIGHRGISLHVARGEILGLYGLVGAGRSELAKAIIGADRITGGAVRVAGEPVAIADVARAVHRHRIGYVSEDRKREGLILAHSIVRNVAMTVWRRLAGAMGWLNRGRERAVAVPLAGRLEIRAPSLAQKVGNLSGGNQQKVSVAKWLAANVEILIIDEPTVGIDVKTKTYLHELIWELASGGTAIILISSDMPEMIALADRIMVMNAFSVVGEIANTRDYDAISQRIMACIHDTDEAAAAG